MTAFDTESATGAAVSAADAARNNANTGDGKAECALSDKDRFSRTKMLIGEDGIETLQKSASSCSVSEAWAALSSKRSPVRVSVRSISSITIPFPFQT